MDRKRVNNFRESKPLPNMVALVNSKFKYSHYEVWKLDPWYFNFEVRALFKNVTTWRQNLPFQGRFVWKFVHPSGINTALWNSQRLLLEPVSRFLIKFI